MMFYLYKANVTVVTHVKGALMRCVRVSTPDDESVEFMYRSLSTLLLNKLRLFHMNFATLPRAFVVSGCLFHNYPSSKFMVAEICSNGKLSSEGNPTFFFPRNSSANICHIFLHDVGCVYPDGMFVMTLRN